jgi:hypothetical protein
MKIENFICRYCRVEFMPTLYKFQRKNYVCNTCANNKKKELNQKRIKEGKEAYKFEYKNKEARTNYLNGYGREGDLKKKRIRNLVYKALKAGRLERKPCEVCGNIKAHAHHSDYNKPLDVIWLCAKHHKEWHMKNEVIDFINK